MEYGDTSYPEIRISSYGQMPVDVLVQEISITYEEKEEVQGFDLWVSDVQVTEENKGDVLGDGLVSFDGHKRLILNNTIMSGITSGLSELEVYLKGSNIMSNTTSCIQYTGQSKGQLTFLTNCNDPGRLRYQNYSGNGITLSEAFPGYALTFRDNLAGTVEHLSSSTDMVTIAVPIAPIVDESPDTTPGEEIHIDYSTDAGEVATENLSNYVANNVLYTLHDTQTAGANDDGYYNGKLIIHSTLTDNAVAAINTQVENGGLVPGTQSYAEQFKGLTFIVPAGSGKITLGTETDNAGLQFHLKIGRQDAVTVVNQADNGGQVCEIPYNVGKATYVYFYLTEGASAPEQTDGPGKIGPKSGVGGGLGSLGVEGSNIVSPPSASSNYLLCTPEMLSRGSNGGITVSNSEVTDIDATAFASYANAPRRALSSQDIPFVDLTQTAITGMDISRSSGAFEGFGEHTIIYVPAGNTTSEPNVVIAGVCEDLQLGAAQGFTKTFAVPESVTSFTAAKATHRLQLSSQPKLVCLPYDLKTAAVQANVYEYGSFNTATDKVVAKGFSQPVIPAHTAHLMKTTGATASLPVATNVRISQPPYMPAVNSSATDGFCGSYSYVAVGSADNSYVCYMNGFKRFSSSYPVYTFEGFLRLQTGSSDLGIEYDDSTLGVEAVSTDVPGTAASGAWYSLTGVRQSAQPTAKGLYIHNGRKVVVK